MSEKKEDLKLWEWEKCSAGWCAGCGDNGLLYALKEAFVSLSLDPARTLLVKGIGCSGNDDRVLKCFTFHDLHGQLLLSATAIKSVNPELTVIASGGDGDGFAIGMPGFMHTLRRNPDITYIVYDNGVYGLTKGQDSPTGEEQKYPFNPLAAAISAGCTFVAQGVAQGVVNPTHHLAKIFEMAIRHKGFSFVNVLTACPTYAHEAQEYNAEMLSFLKHTNTSYDSHSFNALNDEVDKAVASAQKKNHTFEIHEHDVSDDLAAMRRALRQKEKRFIGVFLAREPKPTFEAMEGLDKNSIVLQQIFFDDYAHYSKLFDKFF